jgi:hypothetical protein
MEHERSQCLPGAHRLLFQLMPSGEKMVNQSKAVGE